LLFSTFKVQVTTFLRGLRSVSLLLLSLKKVTKELLQSQTLQERYDPAARGFADSGVESLRRNLRDFEFRQNRNDKFSFLQPAQPAIARARIFGNGYSNQCVRDCFVASLLAMTQGPVIASGAKQSDPHGGLDESSSDGEERSSRRFRGLVYR